MTFGPGDVFLAEDLTARDTRQHRTIGSEPTWMSDSPFPAVSSTEIKMASPPGRIDIILSCLVSTPKKPTARIFALRSPLSINGLGAARKTIGFPRSLGEVIK